MYRYFYSFARNHLPAKRLLGPSSSAFLSTKSEWLIHAEQTLSQKSLTLSRISHNFWTHKKTTDQDRSGLILHAAQTNNLILFWELIHEQSPKGSLVSPAVKKMIERDQVSMLALALIHIDFDELDLKKMIELAKDQCESKSSQSSIALMMLLDKQTRYLQHKRS